LVEILTLVVFANCLTSKDQEIAEISAQILDGFLQGSNLYQLNNIGACVSAAQDAIPAALPILQKLEQQELEQSDLSESTETIIQNAAETCFASIEGVFGAMITAHKLRHQHFADFMYNYMMNTKTFAADTASIAKAMKAKDYYNVGVTYGLMFQTAFGFNISEIQPLVDQEESQYEQMIENVGVGSALPLALQNLTEFITGFGNGFGISGQTGDVVTALTDAWDLIGEFEALIHRQNVVSDLNAIWVDLTTAFEDGTSGVGAIIDDFAPAIKLAETNSTQLEDDFKNNLAAHPLQAAVLAAKLKIDLSTDNWSGAGSTWGSLAQIGLKGLYNITSN